MLKVLIPAAACLALVAFGAQTQSSAPATDALAMDTPVMGWHLSHEGSTAKLAYGVENSDQLALMMTCAPGDSTAVVYGDVQPDTPRLVRASMGPAPIDPLSGGEAYETRIPLQDVSLTGLASGRGMTVTGDAGRFQLAATRDERQVIAGFLAYCGSSRA